MFFAQRFHLLRDLHRLIAVHLNDVVRDVEERAGASRYQNRRYTSLFIQIPAPLQKWRDRLFLPADDLLHEIIPHHKVSGGGIFINQKQPASRLNAFQHACSLGGASAGIRRGKVFRVLAVGQVIDKQGNVSVANRSPLLCPKLHRGLIRQDKFPSIPRDMVIHAHLQSGKQRGFSMIAAPHDQRNACRYCHAVNLSVMRQDKALLHTLRRNKGNAVFHRLVGNAAFSRQNGTVCHKSYHILLFHLAAQLCLVFCQPYRRLQRFPIQIFCEKTFFRCFRQKIKENLLQSACVNGSSKSRKTDVETHGNGVTADLTGAAL